MFPDDMIEQRRKLMAMLAGVVKGLGNLEQVLPAAGALAKRHVGYGAKAEHYPVVGAALLWTLEKGLGDGWTPEVADAWGTAYGTLSGYMISEAYGHSLSVPTTPEAAAMEAASEAATAMETTTDAVPEAATGEMSGTYAAAYAVVQATYAVAKAVTSEVSEPYAATGVAEIASNAVVETVTAEAV